MIETGQSDQAFEHPGPLLSPQVLPLMSHEPLPPSYTQSVAAMNSNELKQGPEPQACKQQLLVGMGFPEDAVIRALAAARGNLEGQASSAYNSSMPPV